MLSNEASVSSRNYTVSDFAEVFCTKLSNLTQTATNIVQAKQAGVAIDTIYQARVDVTTFDNFYDISLEKFHKILCLELKYPGKAKVLEAIEKLEKREDVIYVGPDYILSLAATEPTGQYVDDQWAIDRIQLPEAWDITTGSGAVEVGVIDTGIDGSHLDLGFRVCEYTSKDFTGGNSPLTDPNGHGTQVAGIIGAQEVGGAGIVGVAWNSRLVSLKAFNASGAGYSSVVYDAIDYATECGIPILNISAGWKGNSDHYDYPLRAVIANYPGICICAAGNDSMDIDATAFYPASYDLPNIISVGASERNDISTTFSNWGKNSVDLFAPGDRILTCYPKSKCENGTHGNDGTTHYANGYHYTQGTSMAAPYVAGVAVLILAKYPNSTPAQIKERIMAGVDVVKSASGYKYLQGLCVTEGRLNAYKALHPHTYAYTSINTAYHKWTCQCGATYQEVHTLDRVTFVDISGSAVTIIFCTKCDYES